jgi:hypothetical protein
VATNISDIRKPLAWVTLTGTQDFRFREMLGIAQSDIVAAFQAMACPTCHKAIHRACQGEHTCTDVDPSTLGTTPPFP